jgi:hypothetical protein
MKKIGTFDTFETVDSDDIRKLIKGKTISAIRMNIHNLIIEFGDEYISLEVDGECCSVSEFYDFYGVNNIINKKIIDFQDIALDPTDLKASRQPGDYGNHDIKVYGYKIVCKPNDDFFETSNVAVFSFRNTSNGYYGGSLCYSAASPESSNLKLIEEDILSSSQLEGRNE